MKGRREKRKRVLERESGGEGVSSSECFLSERKCKNGVF